LSAQQKEQGVQPAHFYYGTQFLCFADYLLYKGKETYSINSCEPIEAFYNIREDYEKLQYVAHITKIIDDVTVENQNSYKVLQLYLNTIYIISEGSKNLDFITSVFKLRLLCILGYKPVIDKCVHCGNTDNISAFSIKNNGLACKTCSNTDKSTIEINSTTLYAIKYISMCDAKKLYAFNVSEESLQELIMISKLYTNEKLEKEYILKKID
jgi:DNA repair protein RecO (recombination protein O)